MNKTLPFLLLVLSFSACKKNIVDNQSFKVGHIGALKNMMRKGDVSAKGDLSIFKDTTHFYALGAIENLKGEIQIFDGQARNTRVVGDSLRFSQSFDEKVTLLVYASVKEWQAISIPKNVRTYKDLEQFVALSAKENGIITDLPFPFLLEGKAKSFDWHVINWKDGDREHSHEKHIKSGLYGTVEDREVELLGFYSNAHKAIFTHHTTNMHIHVKTVDQKIAGHLDDLMLGEGMRLKLPK
jgi:acetolactate decarboxylase